jgi:tetratricopeptide (TPR) repeat protein
MSAVQLSACIIVKNEGPVFAATLESLRGRAFEMVVVDGGSTDDSVAIAERYGARVFVDRGDLSAARNRALAEARGTHCLMIDADEVVRADTWPLLLAFLDDGRHPRGRVVQLSETANGRVRVPITRVCVRDGQSRYHGSAHEQLVGPGTVGDTGLVLLHSGYTPETLARKNSGPRNLRLLREELARRPDDPYLHYQLGHTLLVTGDPVGAVACLERALRVLPRDAGYASALACDLGYALKAAGRPAAALEAVKRFQRALPDFTDLWFLEGLCHMALGRAAEMLRAFERCLELGEPSGHPTVMGVGSFRAQYNIGLYHELAGDPARARRHYELAVAGDPGFRAAEDRLRRLPLAHTPSPPPMADGRS